jgi:hypothetical protein
MAYVKISDPNIIDISAWQELVNVVNQHSDSITAITNNFNGISSTATDWTAANWSHVWDPGSQAIVYGKIQVDTTSASKIVTGTSASPSADFYGTASYSDSTISSTFQFSSTPIVTATLYSGHATDGTTSSTNDSCLVTVYDITTTGFSWRVSSATPKTPPTGTLYIMWTALGPR